MIDEAFFGFENDFRILVVFLSLKFLASDYRIIGLSDYRIIGLSDRWILGRMMLTDSIWFD